MTRYAVSSSLIASLAYSEHATLDVELRCGSVYRFFAVPPRVFEALLAADSKGAYFNRVVKPRFAFQRLSS